MASNIIQGTLGNPDWIYLNANPLVTATNINAYEPYKALTYMLNYDEIVKYYNLNSVDRMLYNKSLYGNTNELQKQVKFYKCGFYHERDLFNNSIKTYSLYYNKNGEIVNGMVEIDGENYFFVDEHTTATDGKYELREALEQEFRFGTYNWNYSVFFPPLFPNVKTVDVCFCNSSKVTLVRAADIIANKIYHNKCKSYVLNSPRLA